MRFTPWPSASTPPPRASSRVPGCLDCFTSSRSFQRHPRRPQASAASPSRSVSHDVQDKLSLHPAARGVFPQPRGETSRDGCNVATTCCPKPPGTQKFAPPNRYTTLRDACSRARPPRPAPPAAFNKTAPLFFLQASATINQRGSPRLAKYNSASVNLA